MSKSKDFQYRVLHRSCIIWNKILFSILKSFLYTNNKHPFPWLKILFYSSVNPERVHCESFCLLLIVCWSQINKASLSHEQIKHISCLCNQRSDFRPSRQRLGERDIKRQSRALFPHSNPIHTAETRALSHLKQLRIVLTLILWAELRQKLTVLFRHNVSGEIMENSSTVISDIGERSKVASLEFQSQWKGKWRSFENWPRHCELNQQLFELSHEQKNIIQMNKRNHCYLDHK